MLVSRKLEIILLFFFAGCTPSPSNLDLQAYTDYLSIPEELNERPPYLQSRLGLQRMFCKAAFDENYLEVMSCYNEFVELTKNNENWVLTESVSEMDDSLSFSLITLSSPYSISDNDFRQTAFIISCDSFGWETDFMTTGTNGKIVAPFADVRVDRKQAIEFRPVQSDVMPTEQLAYFLRANEMLVQHLTDGEFWTTQFDISRLETELGILEKKCKLL